MKNVYWTQNSSGKWQLMDERGNPHHCDDGKLKAVKCKYCPADDLHWAEDINPQTQVKKMVLTESYGLQHACDERITFLAKEKQEKKDKYESEKKRVAAHPDGICPSCNGGGYDTQKGLSAYTLCGTCHGQGSFSERTRKQMLADERRKIWPNMQEYSTFPRGRRW